MSGDLRFLPDRDTADLVGLSGPGRCSRSCCLGRRLDRRYPGDAGFDLLVRMDATVPARGRMDIELSGKIELPEGWWGLLTGRSSTLRTLGLLVPTSIIDQGWRGPLFAYVVNLGDTAVRLTRGSRIAQLIPIPLFSGGISVVSELSDSVRGEQGFGSTGR